MHGGACGCTWMDTVTPFIPTPFVQQGTDCTDRRQALFCAHSDGHWHRRAWRRLELRGSSCVRCGGMGRSRAHAYQGVHCLIFCMDVYAHRMSIRVACLSLSGLVWCHHPVAIDLCVQGKGNDASKPDFRGMDRAKATRWRLAVRACNSAVVLHIGGGDGSTQVQGC